MSSAVDLIFQLSYSEVPITYYSYMLVSICAAGTSITFDVAPLPSCSTRPAHMHHILVQPKIPPDAITIALSIYIYTSQQHLPFRRLTSASASPSSAVQLDNAPGVTGKPIQLLRLSP